MKEITKFPFKIRFDGHDLSAEEVTEEMLFQNFRFIRVFVWATFTVAQEAEQQVAPKQAVNGGQAADTAIRTYMTSLTPQIVVCNWQGTAINGLQLSLFTGTLRLWLDLIWLEETREPVPPHSHAKRQRYDAMISHLLQLAARQKSGQVTGILHLTEIEKLFISYEPHFTDDDQKSIASFKKRWTAQFKRDLQAAVAEANKKINNL